MSFSPPPTPDLDRLSKLPTELYLLILEEIGKETIGNQQRNCLRPSRPAWASLPPGFPPSWALGREDAATNADAKEHTESVYPSIDLLNASTINSKYRDKYLQIALRLDAESENPRAIYHAAVNNHTTLLRQALGQDGARPDHVPHGLALPLITPLMLAAVQGNVDAVDLLLGHGANPGYEFHSAGFNVWRPRPGLFSTSYDTMLKEPEDVGVVTKVTPAHCAMAAVQNADRIAWKILRAAPDEFWPNSANANTKLLAFAVAADLVDLIESFVVWRADFNHGGLTVDYLSIPVLHHAVSGAMVRKLLDLGAPLHTPPHVGLNALHAVCLRSTDCHTAIEELVRRGVDVDEATAGGRQRSTLINIRPCLLVRTPQTALNFACRRLNLPHIRALLRLGANPLGVAQASKTTNCDHDNGEFRMVTPFHDLFLPDDLSESLTAGRGTALRKTLYEVVRGMLAHPHGRRALSLRQSVRFDTRDVDSKIDQRYWVERSILKREDYGEFTPFQLFFMRPLVDDERIPAMMLSVSKPEIRLQINMTTRPYGVTPLLALLSHRFDHGVGEESFYRPQLVEWLLKNGADPNIADSEGFTPLHYAAFWLDDRAVDLLLAYGASVENRHLVLPTPLEVVLGRVYTEDHGTVDLRDSIWRQMVRLIEQDREQGPADMFGIQSCIKRWQPGGPLPLCSLPGFEVKFRRHVSSGVFFYNESGDQSLHEELRKTGLVPVLTQHALERKARIFEVLLQANGTLPLPIPRWYNWSQGKVYRNSVLDWAAATGQHQYFLERLWAMGGMELVGDVRPSFEYKTVGWGESRENWDRYKRMVVEHAVYQ
ncbi:Putative ankyrin repeat-containing domain superfamily [Colletotrichum destructivum]|uniref:Ankyrin repeat-containing domain superfamily n=1 Tax=Colletotrichum destructivum TaxID=34406 RepID=A0AAX4IC35_9PEZI|nr:Putative ankyrin repeat-containing domain superfamily [Colletotrichum destructivum]